MRRARFKEVQLELQEKGVTDIRPILKYSPSRWSSLFEASERIKLLWFSLEKYFDEIPNKRSLPDLSQKNNLYLDLLCSLLKRVNSHLVFFQDDNHDYSRIMPKIRETFCLMSELILKKQNSQNEDAISRFDYLIRLPFQDHNAIEPHLLTDIDFRSGFLNKFPELGYIEHLQIDSSILNDFFDSAKAFITVKIVQIEPHWIKYFSKKIILKLNHSQIEPFNS